MARNTKIRILTQAVLVVLLAQQAEQYGSGAPALACVTMMPSHSGIAAMTSPAPYTVTPSAPQVRQGDTLRVTVSSPTDTPIGGFLLQARQVQDPSIILGKFTSLPNAQLMHFTSCSHDNDSVTHSSTETKTGLTFDWQAPDDYLGAFFFRATVAQGYAQFWTNIESSLVEIVTPDTVITTTAPSATTAPTATTVPSLPAAVETQTATPIDPIYEGCGDTKLCFGTVDNCVSSMSCPAVVAVTAAGETYTFEVQAIDSPAYVAAALSYTRDMGDASAMECVQENGRVNLHSSWTYNKVDPYVTRENVPNILQLQSSSYNDGKLYCQFTRDANSTVMNTNFDLVNGQYILIIVAGRTLMDAGRVGFHNIGHERTGELVSLASTGSVSGASKILLRLHGCFMVAAWLGAASCGILFARYFRQTWVGKNIGGKDVWFAWHRILMVLTWLLTMSGFIIILVEVGGWSNTGDNPHAITGLVTVILCFIQPIGAFFRPHPGTPKRPIFNWGHWFIGNAAHILGIVTIFFAVYLSKADLPEWTIYILASFVVFHVIMHLVLSLSQCVSDGRISNGRVNSFPMKDMMTNNRQAMAADKKSDAPHSGFRRSLLALYTTVVLLLVIAVICIVALAPIGTTVQSVSSAINKAMGST